MSIGATFSEAFFRVHVRVRDLFLLSFSSLIFEPLFHIHVRALVLSWRPSLRHSKGKEVAAVLSF
jgi:hypothetical protein